MLCSLRGTSVLAATSGPAIIVTTAPKPSVQMLQEAHDVSGWLEAAFVPREAAGRKLSLTRLLDAHGVQFAYVVARVNGGGSTEVRHEIRRRADSQRLHVHPRQWRWMRRFASQPLARAICAEGEAPPASVVDATAGLGGTALRMAEGFGPACRITTVEKSAPLACLLSFGMRTLAAQPKPWAPAASRITCVHADAANYFEELVAAGSGPARPEVIFLNPCLDLRRQDPSDLFLQELAELAPISARCLHSAMEVATRRVVLRVPVGADPLAASHGVLATRAVEATSSGQSNYLVFDVN